MEKKVSALVVLRNINVNTNFCETSLYTVNISKNKYMFE